MRKTGRPNRPMWASGGDRLAGLGASDAAGFALGLAVEVVDVFDRELHAVDLAALAGLVLGVGQPPDHVHVSATVTFAQVGEAWTVTRSELDVVGTVPGLDEAGFDAAAQTAKEGCPISRALAGNVEISVHSTVEDAHD